MPQFSNYDKVKGRFSEGFQQLEPGAYVAIVQAVRHEWEERDFQTGLNRACSTRNDAAVLLIFDIAEGQFAGEFSRDYFMNGGYLDASKDFMHQWRFTWGDLNNQKDAERTRYVLDTFTACNPGFDALAAFNADNFGLFVGKKFVVLLNGTVKTNDRGYDQWTLRTSTKIYTLQDLKDGTIPEPRITDKRTQIDKAVDAARAQAPTSYDTPFAAQPAQQSQPSFNDMPPAELYSDVPF